MSAPHPSLSEVTIVMVTYNSAHCLPAVAAQLERAPHVIVVDNASQDPTVDDVRRLLPQARVLVNPENRGFGSANNRALDQVATPYALVLNPDCEMSAEQIAALLTHAHQTPQAALLAPQLTDADGRDTVNYRWPATAWKSSGPGAQGPCCVGFLCGAALLFNMAVMRPIGFFDTRFFLYYEDDDLCLRVFQAGQPMLLVPQIRVPHRSRGSSGSRGRWRTEYLRGYHHAQSKVMFEAKHLGSQRATQLHRRTLLLSVPLVALRLLTLSPRHASRAFGRLMGLLQLKAPVFTPPVR